MSSQQPPVRRPVAQRMTTPQDILSQRKREVQAQLAKGSPPYQYNKPASYATSLLAAHTQKLVVIVPGAGYVGGDAPGAGTCCDNP